MEAEEIAHDVREFHVAERRGEEGPGAEFLKIDVSGFDGEVLDEESVHSVALSRCAAHRAGEKTLQAASTPVPRGKDAETAGDAFCPVRHPVRARSLLVDV